MRVLRDSVVRARGRCRVLHRALHIRGKRGLDLCGRPVYVHCSTVSRASLPESALRCAGRNLPAAIAFDETRHVSVELAVGNDARHTSGFGGAPALDVYVRTEGERRHTSTLRP